MAVPAAADAGNQTLSDNVTPADQPAELINTTTPEATEPEPDVTPAENTDLETPVANFTADKIYGGIPLEVNFTDYSAGESITGWFWDFGDGKTSAEQEAAHTYDTPGRYTVSLTVTNGGGSNTTEIQDCVFVTEKTVIADESDWPCFQNNNYHTGVTTGRAPVAGPDMELSWDALTGYQNSDAVAIGDILFVASSENDPKMMALDKTTGEVLWESEFPKWNLASAAYGNGMIFLPKSTGGQVIAYDAKTGHVVWSAEAIGGKYGQINTPIVYEDHKIYFGNAYGSSKAYYCYSDMGEEIWTHPAPEGSLGYYYSGAALIGDYLIYGDESSYVICLNKETGEAVDEFDVLNLFGYEAGTYQKQIRSSMVYEKKSSRLYFTSKAGYCHSIGFNADDGTFDRENIHLGSIGASVSTPVVCNDRVYIGGGSMWGGSGNPTFYCLNASDLSEIWNFTSNGPVQSSAAVSTYYEDKDGCVYIYFTTNAKAGSVYCLRDFPGNTEADEAWHYTPPAEKQEFVLAGPVISEGYVYFGNNHYGNTGGYTFGLYEDEPELAAVNFTADIVSGVAPVTVNFTDTSSGRAIHRWAWDFDNDGVVDSTAQNATWVCESPGTYSVNLTITNPAGESSQTKEEFIFVDVAPPEGPSIELKTGWNFVSTPKRLAEENNTVAIFEPVETEDHSVFSYDPVKGWASLDKTETLRPLEGIWIYSAEHAYVKLDYDTNPLQTPPTRELTKGWNSVGFSDTTPASAKAALFTVEDSWAAVLGYNAEEQRYETSILYRGSGAHDQMRQLMPGKGYWLYMKDEGELVAIS